MHASVRLPGGMFQRRHAPATIGTQRYYAHAAPPACIREVPAADEYLLMEHTSRQAGKFLRLVHISRQAGKYLRLIHISRQAGKFLRLVHIFSQAGECLLLEHKPEKICKCLFLEHRRCLQMELSKSVVFRD